MKKSKKTIHRDKIRRFYSGEGYNRSISILNAQTDAARERLRREEEEREERIEQAREEFIINSRQDLPEVMSDEDREALKAWSKAVVFPEEIPFHNKDEVRKLALQLYNKIAEKYSPTTIYKETGINPLVGIEALYNLTAREQRLALDKLTEKPEEYLDYRNMTSPSSSIVNLNTDTASYETSDRNVLPEVTIRPQSKAQLREDIIVNTLDRYNDALLSLAFDKLYGLVSKPNGYGLFSSKWWNDATGTFLSRLNTTQALDFLGRMDVADERLERVQNAVAYLDALDIRKLYDELSKSGQPLSHELLQELWKAQEDSKAFKNDYYYVQSLIPTSGILGIGDLSDEVKRFINENAGIGADYGAEWFDYNDIMRKDLRGVLGANKAERHAILDKFKGQVDKYKAEWKHGAEVNFAEAEEAEKKYNISEWYKQLELLASDDFWSLDSWMYKQAGLLGASQSSALKSWTATGLNLLTGGLAKTAGQRLLTAAATMPMSVSASQEENYAEVAEGYKSRLKQLLKANGEYDNFIKEASEKLGTTDEELIFNQFQLGNFVPTNRRLLEIAARATYGLGALFLSDMMATTFDDVFTTTLELTPLGHLSKASKLGKVTASMGKYSGGGPAAVIIGTAADATARSVAKSSLGKAVKKRVAGLIEFSKAVPEKVLGKKAAERLASITGKNSIPHRVLGELGYARYAAVKGIGKSIAKRVAGSMIFEGLEEGKQYLNQQRYLSGEYDDQEYMGLLNSTRFINDTYAMAKSAYVMAGFPLFLNLTDDDELIANIKGGMKGGMMQTGVTSTIQSVPALYQQLKWADFLNRNVMLEKMSERDFWEKGIMYSKRALGGGSIEDLDIAFDNLLSSVNNNTRSQEDIKAATDLIEQQRKTAHEIFKTANSKFTKDAAKANGIDVDSQRYHAFVSLMSLINQQGQEAYQKVREQSKIVDRLVTEIESPYTVEAGTGNVIDQRIRKHTGDILQSYVQQEVDKDGNLLTGEKLASHADAQFRAVTSIAANIAALTKIKTDLETAKTGNTLFALSKRDINFLLKRVLENINQNLEYIRAELRQDFLKNAESLLSDVENSEELINATRLNMLYQFEVDYFDTMMGGILGKYGKPEEGSEEAKRNLPYSLFNANDLIDDILKSVDNDYLLSQRIEQDWQNTVDARSEMQERLRQSKLKKEAKRKAREERKKEAKNKPKDDSENTETSETGQKRKKRKSLSQKIKENKQKRNEKKQESQQPVQPVSTQGPEISELENQASAEPAQQPQAPRQAPQSSVTQPEVLQQEQPQVKPVLQQSEQEGSLVAPIPTAPTQQLPEQPAQPQYGSNNKLITRDRYEQAKARMRQKLLGQLNANFDPEIISIGAEMAMYHIEAGSRKFADFAKKMIEDLGDAIRPYLQGIYESAKRMPGMEQLRKEMDSTEFVDNIDVNTFDKQPDSAGPLISGAQQPTGEPGDNQTAADRAFSTDVQKAAYNKLEERANRESLLINIDLRTGHNYFITVNGRLRMYDRVHNYLDPQYKPNPEEIAHERKVSSELTAAYNESFDKFKEVALKYVDEFNAEFKDRGGFKEVNISTYLSYIQENPQEAKDVIDAISNLVSRIPADYAVVIGEVVDGICRKFFSGQPVEYDESVSKWILKSAFDSLLQELNEIKIHYNNLGWALFAQPVYLYTEFYDSTTGQIRRIAGETDMIAVDKNGHYHIIDFKTSYLSYADRKDMRGGRENVLDKKGTFGLNDLRAKVRTTREYYTDQQTAYYVMMRNALPQGEVDSIELLPFRVSYSFVWNTKNTSLGQSISRVFTDQGAPVREIVNKSPVLDDNNEYIKDESKNIIRRVLRIPLNPSTGMIEKLLTADQTERLKQIVEGSIFDLEDYINNLDESDRQRITNDTRSAITSNIEERARILRACNSPVQLSLSEWVDIIKQVESLNDVANSIISQIDVDIAESLKLPHYSPKEEMLIDEVWDQQAANFINSVAESFTIEVRLLYRLLESLYKRGIKSTEDISAQEFGDIDQHIANIEWILLVYPEASQLLPQALKEYNDVIAWFNNTVGEYVPQLPPQEILEKSFVEDRTEKWYNMTTTWLHTLDESVGIEDSVATDDPNLKLLSVTSKPDFINNAVFELKIFPVKYNGRLSNRLHLIVHYGGHTYTPVSIHTADGSRSLWNAVLIAQAHNPGKSIIITNNSKVHRSNGRMIPGQMGTLKEKGLVSDFFGIEYSSDQKTFAVTRERKNPKTGLNEIVAIVPGMDGGRKVELYNYGTNSTMRAGMTVMMATPVQEEHSDPKNQPRIPINLIGRRLTKEDAKLILGILRLLYVQRDSGEVSRDMLDREFYEDGMGKGFTCKQILRMLIPYGGRAHENKRNLHLAYDSASMNIVHIYGYVRGDKYEYDENNLIKDKDRAFDISTPAGLLDFIDFISENVDFDIDERLLAPKLNAAIREDHPFYGLTKFMNSPAGANYMNSGKTLTFGLSSIRFDISDMRDENNPANHLGLSGLGYFIKRGLIQTNYSGLENALINIDNDAPINAVSTISSAKPESTPEPKTPTTKEDVRKQVAEAVNPPVEEIAGLGSVNLDAPNEDYTQNVLYLDKVESTPSEKKLKSEKQVRKHLRRIFGKNGVPAEIIDDVIEVLSQDANVVGRCYADAILLSKKAPVGTEYHEAFHRVAEILMSEEDRNNLYDEFRRTRGLATPESKRKRKKSDVLIREDIADSFMMFMSGMPSVSDLFLHIKKWVDWFKNIGSFKLFWFYTQVGILGKFRNAAEVAESKKRFLTLYKNGLNATIRDVQFKHILNNNMYRELRKTLMYAALDANKIDPAGRNIQDLNLDKDIVMKSGILKFALEDKSVPESTRLAMQELMDNWDVVADDVARDISDISTDYMKRFELENEEDAESMEDAESANIEQHIKASYEFSQFHRTSSLVRFFFARIPMCEKVEVGEDGKKKTPSKLNRLGLPQYMDVKYVFNSVLNKLHDIESKSELLERLLALAENDPMYFHIYKRLKTLADNAKTNVDDSQLFTLIYNVLRSAKQEFEIAIASTNQRGEFDLRIIDASSEYSARNYKKEWSDMFFSGGSLFVNQDQNGRVVMNSRFRAKIFRDIAARFQELKYAFSEESELPNAAAAVYAGLIFDRTNSNHIAGVKRNFVLILNELGILFDLPMLDYMLLSKYGDSGYKGMKALLSDSFGNTSNSSTRSSFEVFTALIASLCTDNGNLAINLDNLFTFEDKLINADSIFNGKGASFVSELSTYKYNYRHEHDQLSVLAAKNNKFYVISENNLITDTAQDLNRALHGWSESVEDGMSFDYNLFQPNSEDDIDPSKPVYGSAIYKTILNVRSGKMLAPNVRVVTFSGFKSGQPGDIGEDYTGISQREDYISKVAILLGGGLVFPTMSDKKTWTYLRGIELAGINYDNLNSINQFRSDGSMTLLDSVVRQIWEYAMCERKAIGSCLREMRGYTDQNGVQHPPMSEDELVDNYYKATAKVGKKKIPIVQGARFTSLLGVYNENGEYIEFNRVLDDNGNVMSEEDNIKIADREFFNPKEIVDPQTGENRLETEDELYRRQFRMIEEVLQKQLVDELAYAESLGLIERNADLSGKSSIEQYRNVGLPIGKLNAVAKKLNDKYETLSGTDKAIVEARAIAILMNDMMVKHLQSTEEVERVFSGHPSFFKFKYDEDGHLVDRTTDQHKRFGGLVSTGQNNDMELNIPGEYTQAEIDNEMVGSLSIEDIRHLMLEGELRSTYLRYTLDAANATMDKNKDKAKNLAEIADSMSLEDILKNLPKNVYDIAVALATKKASKFEKGIDVADGGAYMTDEMCENLLRMVGSWNSKVAKAFEILRGMSPSSITERADAYNLVWTTVIGAQKYTAYGFRHQRGVQVPYYNKMALFPLFKCICTGNMAKIYNKMKSDGVDILCIQSAVKTGSQGSKPIDFSSYRVDDDPSNDNNFIGNDVGQQNWKPSFEKTFHFNTYKQKYSYLRKLFNTDPKESEAQNIGTQMMKVALSALMPGREYMINGGAKMDATQVRDEIMNCINTLSDMGLETIRKLFFKDEELDVEKFSKFLTEELVSRNASQEMIDACSIVTGKDGKPHFKVPLAAMSNLNFIQSILVSKINKEIVDVKTPGGTFVQRSVFAMEGETRVLGDKNLPKNLYDGRKLKMVNEEGSMDCVVSIDFFDDIIPKKDGKRLSFEEAKQWLINNGIISGVKTGETEWSNAKAGIVAYRIPTQAISSIHALRVVDVIPVVRDTVILPEEFTTITGSDFDIDKLYMQRKNYQFVSKSFDETTGFDMEYADVLSTFSDYPRLKKDRLSDIYPSNTPQHVQNKLLDYYISILCDVVEVNGKKTTRSMLMLHASIDSHTELLTDIDDDLQEGIKQSPLKPYDAYMLRKQNAVKTDFITGKFGIGPFALNNNNHILTMLYGVKFAQLEGSILTRLNMFRLDKSSDLDGRSILEWLSGLINLHVDNAKDPRIARLNVNKYTYNLVNLMVRTGFGKRTFWFTTQPIMKALAEAYNNSQGSYMIDTEMSAKRRAEIAEELVIVNFAKAHDIDANNTEDVIAEWKARLDIQGIKSNDLIDGLLKDNAEIMHTISKKYSSRGSDLSTEDSFLFNGKQLSFFDVQMAIFVANRQLKPYYEALSDLVKYTKIDTKKHGKNINEQRQYLRGYNSMFSPSSKGRSRMMFDTKSLDNLVKNSYIETKTINATRAFSLIFGNATIQGTDLFQDQLNTLMTITGNDDYGNAKTIGKLSGAILAKRKSQWINDYAKKHNIDIKGLVDGKNTIFDRLGKFKLAIMTDSRYAHLRGTDGLVNNYMLRVLIQGRKYSYKNNLNMGAGTLRDDYTNAKFIDTFSFLDDETINADDFIEGWRELLNDNTTPGVLRFARDLIVYAFVVAADNGGSHDLFKLVPNDWKINPDNENLDGAYYSENSYAAYMLNLISAYRRGVNSLSSLTDYDIDDILLNNWYDDTFVKKEYTYYNNLKRFEQLYLGDILVTEKLIIAGQGLIEDKHLEQITYPSILCGITRSEDAWDVTYDPEHAPRFIKVKRDSCKDPLSQRRYNIYKLVGTGTKYNITTDNNGMVTRMAVLYPIYAMVDARGNEFDNGNRIYAYGQVSPLMESTLYTAKLNELIKIAEDKLSPEERRDLPSLLANLAKRYATKWDDALKKMARNRGGDPFTDVVEDLSESYLPSDINRIALEEWSKKEGWSTEYFLKNIYPRIDNAYQIEFELLEDLNVPYKFYGNMDRLYEGNLRNDITSSSTIEAIKKGERTATTRFKNLDYWSNVLVGDVIEWRDGNGNTVKVRCTSPLTSLADIFDTGSSSVDSMTSRTVDELRRTPLESYQGIPNHYDGLIKPDANTIFVFGSNPEGRHGAGAAKTARKQFGAVYGQGEGLLGNSYALPTKDLRTPDWAKTSDNSYEVSSRGDSRFSALNARFKQGTILFGHDLSGRTIESVYQHGVKQGDWVTDDNNKTGIPRDKTIITGNTEDASYEQGYLPLWREWAKQNPELIEELSQKSHGKTLTDQFANTRVSQARALSDIIRDTKSYRSISPKQIIENIKRMYDVARLNPNKQFKVAYTNRLDEATLNGYTGEEMIEMFKNAGPIPSNVYFSKVWTDNWDYISRC